MAKPKIKSNKSAAKRFRVTGKGKLRFQKAGRRHLLAKKSARRKRGLRRMATISGTDARRIRRALPNL